jgi:hypothetical protein
MLKLCSRHQINLRSALKHKGLWHLVSQDPIETQRRATAWLAGRMSAEEFDPLVASTFEIFKKATDICGPYINGVAEFCPLCEACRVMQKPLLDDAWINACTDLMLAICQNNGILTRATV